MRRETVNPHHNTKHSTTHYRLFTTNLFTFAFTVHIWRTFALLYTRCDKSGTCKMIRTPTHTATDYAGSRNNTSQFYAVPRKWLVRNSASWFIILEFPGLCETRPRSTTIKTQVGPWLLPSTSLNIYYLRIIPPFGFKCWSGNFNNELKTIVFQDMKPCSSVVRLQSFGRNP